MTFIHAYASIFIKKDFFIIGGDTHLQGSNGNVKTIARLDPANWTWHEAGQLNHARQGHGVIWLDNKLVVVGGFTPVIESCHLENNQFICVDNDQVSETSFDNYNYYPLLFVVKENLKNC